MSQKDKRKWEMLYVGQGVSLNQFYSQGHYYRRNEIKNKYTDIFRGLIEDSNVEFLDKYKITCYYNSRHDPLNVAGTIKMFEDALAGCYNRKKKEYKYPPLIKDDSKEYCKGIEIYPDLKLKNNSFKFIIEEQ